MPKPIDRRKGEPDPRPSPFAAPESTPEEVRNFIEAELRVPLPAVVTSTDPGREHVMIHPPKTLREALERIATGRLCGCPGDHDSQIADCPKTIARAALEG